ncbi:hypothetical protein ACIRQY_01875 [Streptomyces sp. NPDC101490]|uniref:hypothetical protein n=1 Tax=Streptomyces sp. NPDC101490 TaxID=3366143 RepID=UPI003817FBB3
MTAASSRGALKALAVTTAALGAVLVSGSGAFADSAPSPVKIVVADKVVCKSPSDQGKSGGKSRVVGKDGAVICLQPSERGRSAAALPRGGVAAGERPVAAQGDGSPTTVIVGATAATVTLAVAGTVVIRRRTAHHDAR